MIEGILPNRYGVAKRKLKSYLTLEHANALNPKITFTFLMHSRTVHALDYDNQILVHPDCFIEMGKRKLRSSIKAALRAQYSL